MKRVIVLLSLVFVFFRVGSMVGEEVIEFSLLIIIEILDFLNNRLDGSILLLEVIVLCLL